MGGDIAIDRGGAECNSKKQTNKRNAASRTVLTESLHFEKGTRKAGSRGIGKKGQEVQRESYADKIAESFQ